MPAAESIPDYQEQLGAYHEAFALELERMVADLPIAGGARVLDMACGDGVYSAWLSERVGEGGEVVAADLLPVYLNLAKQTVEKRGRPGRVEYVTSAIEDLPFDDGAFDLVWCAQSLYSLPEPVSALTHLRRVVKPGGVVAVLENDSLHQVILPWPVEIELAVRRAELEAFVARSEHPRKFYVARHLGRVFRAAGLDDCRMRTYAHDRRAPLGPAERTYFLCYLRQLREQVGPYLDSANLAVLDRLVDPSAGGLLDAPDLNVTCVDHVVWGRRPGGPAPADRA